MLRSIRYANLLCHGLAKVVSLLRHDLHLVLSPDLLRRPPSPFVAYRFDLSVEACRTLFFSTNTLFMNTKSKQKEAINIGQLFMTQGVNRQVADSSLFSRFVLGCVGRHRYQDWGDSSAHDKEMNDYSLQHGGRIISSYNLPKGLQIRDSYQRQQTRVWIITEANRAYTTVLFPSEY